LIRKVSGAAYIHTHTHKSQVSLLLYISFAQRQPFSKLIGKRILIAWFGEWNTA